MILVVETFEGAAKRPVLIHEFPGTTLKDCYRIMGVHAKYDAFLRASLTTGVFHGLTLTNRYTTR